MRHFSVLVVTPEEPIDGILDRALQPFHEFECTGTVDEYVQSVDQLEEAREEFASSTIHRIREPNGALHSPYDDRFYRDPTEEESKKIGPIAGSGCGSGLSWSSKDWGDGRGYRTKVRFVPEGWEEVDLKRSEMQSFAEFVQDYYSRKLVLYGEDPDLNGDHKYGWYRLGKDGDVIELIDRTNPNKHWDWWKVGGRSSGALTPKVGATGVKGEPGLMGCQANAAGVDMIRKGDVDFEAMRAAAKAEAVVRWNKVRGIVGDLSDFVSWDEMREVRHKGDIEAARTSYHDQAAKKLIAEASKKDRDLFWLDLEDFACTLDEYVQREADKATCFFAMLKDGEWTERGNMGWWGCVSDEKSDWYREFNKALDEIPDDHWLTVVDCHI